MVDVVGTKVNAFAHSQVANHVGTQPWTKTWRPPPHGPFDDVTDYHPYCLPTGEDQAEIEQCKCPSLTTADPQAGSRTSCPTSTPNPRTSSAPLKRGSPNSSRRSPSTPSESTLSNTSARTFGRDSSGQPASSPWARSYMEVSGARRALH